MLPHPNHFWFKVTFSFVHMLSGPVHKPAHLYHNLKAHYSSTVQSNPLPWLSLLQQTFTPTILSRFQAPGRKVGYVLQYVLRMTRIDLNTSSERYTEQNKNSKTFMSRDHSLQSCIILKGNGVVFSHLNCFEYFNLRF